MFWEDVLTFGGEKFVSVAGGISGSWPASVSSLLSSGGRCG